MRVPKWVYFVLAAVFFVAIAQRRMTSSLWKTEKFEMRSTSLKAVDCPDNTRSQDGSCLMVNTLEYPTSTQVGMSAA